MSSGQRSIARQLLMWTSISSLIAIGAIVLFIRSFMIPVMTDEALKAQTRALAQVIAQIITASPQSSSEMLAKPDSLDRYTNDGKMVATIFVRKDGQFVRAATSLKKEDGSRAVGTALDAASAAAKALTQGTPYSGPIELFKRPHIATYLPLTLGDGQQGAVFVGIDYGSASELLQVSHRMVLIIGIAGAVSIILLAVILAVVIRRQVSNPLQAFISMTRELADGNGDLTRRLPTERGDELSQVAAAFNVFLKMLHDMFVDFKAEAHQMQDSSEKLGAVVHNTNGQAHTQQEFTAKVAAAIEEISVSISQVANQAGRSKATADAVKRGADEGMGDVDNLSASLTKTSDATKVVSETTQSFLRDVAQIDELVTMVAEVAEQTNLLALNAAIEAARAGEQGRGFAVVADEVRKLATRSSNTANSIRETTVRLGEQSDKVSSAMAGSETSLQECVASMGKLQHSLNAITQAIDEVAVSADEVSHTVAEQSAAAQEIAQSMESIATTGQSTVSQMEIAATIAQELEGVSKTMTTALEGFRTTA